MSTNLITKFKITLLLGHWHRGTDIRRSRGHAVTVETTVEASLKALDNLNSATTTFFKIFESSHPTTRKA